MTQSINELLIRLFVHPLHRDEPVDFKQAIRGAERVLVAVPQQNPSHPGLNFDPLVQLFKKNAAVILERRDPAIKEKSSKKAKSNSNILLRDIDKVNYWQLRSSEDLRNLDNEKYDILIDLDPAVNLLHLYVCRLLGSPVRISFSKEGAEQYYNLVYNGGRDKPLQDRIDGLTTFLQSLVA